MKDNIFVKTWNIIYPIFIYYVVSNVVIYFVVLLMGVTEATYQKNYMLLQTIATVFCIPFIYGYYRRDRLMYTVFHQRTANEWSELTTHKKLQNGILALLCGALAGVVLNNVIGAIGLSELSEGYQNVTAHFYAGGIWIELIGVGLLVPLVEEILYRGVVYARLADWIGIPVATIVSALIFGALHFNLVQFVYASLMGVILVFWLEKNHNISGAILAHIGANILTVLRVETGILDWMQQTQLIYWASTLILAGICAFLLYIQSRRGN